METNWPPDGIYRLPNRIQNPAGDKRKRYGNWWEIREIAAGLWEIVTVEREAITVRELRPLGGKYRRYGNAWEGRGCDRVRAAYTAVVEHLVPESRNFATVTAEWFDSDAIDILQLLVKENTLTLDQIEQARQRVMSDDEDAVGT